MRARTFLIVLTVCAWCGVATALEERHARELSCLPVDGYIRLPGIMYDDLTPLAREVFHDNPALVTNALYALPVEEREDFINLYLEPSSREKHSYFFARCHEVAERNAVAATVDGGEIIPKRLRDELRERQKVRLALHEGAVPFRVGDRVVRIPLPVGYVLQDGPLPAGIDLLEGNRAVFARPRPAPADDGVAPPPDVFAMIRQVREGKDSLASTLDAYRIMVDQDWRLIGIYPPEATPEEAETVEYKWNLQPFAVRSNSFCYGQFEKTTDFHGVNRIRYRSTAVILLPGRYIQVAIAHTADTGLEMVGEINNDLSNWRDAILTANWE